MMVAASAALLLGVAGTANAAPKAAPNAVGATLTSATISLNTLVNTSTDSVVTISVLDVNGRVDAQAIGAFGQLGNGNIIVGLKVRPNVRWETLVGGSVRIAFNGDGTWAFGYHLDLVFSDGDISETAEPRVVLDPAHSVHTHPLQFVT
jgi:hypothetical protein